MPAGLEKDLAKADYPVKGSLPAIIATRKLNRGIESLAVSADEKFLYFVMQSPLCNPNCKAYKNSLNARLFKFDIGQSEAVGQYLYLMDAPASFAADNKKKKRKKSDVKLSEMVTVGKDRLLVLERISETTKFYIVDLNGANTVPAKFDRRTTKPSLEQIEPAGFSGAGLTPLKKTLVLNTDNHKGFPSKIEGIGLIGEKEMLLVNDNDFGITGRKTQILRVKFDEAVLK